MINITPINTYEDTREEDKPCKVYSGIVTIKEKRYVWAKNWKHAKQLLLDDEYEDNDGQIGKAIDVEEVREED